MMYSKVRKVFRNVASNLLSTVNVDKHDYTHQPSDDECIYAIDNAIETLTALKYDMNTLKFKE